MWGDSLADEKRYYWLKLKDDFFQSRKMKKLRKVAGGDTYTIIYLKLQLLSINNDGVIEFEGTDEDIFHQLSLDIDEEIDDIKMTVAFCTTNDLIEVQQDDLFLSDVPNLIGSEAASTRRSRKHRQRKALEAEAEQQEALKSNGQALQCNTRATRCNTEIEKEIDIERRDRDKSKKDDEAWQAQIMDTWNQLDKNIPRIQSLNPNTNRYRLIKARINENGLDKVLGAIGSINQSPFLQGYVTDFVISFDWFIKPNNFIKVLEGNYKDKDVENKQKHNNYAQKAREERFRKILEG